MPIGDRSIFCIITIILVKYFAQVIQDVQEVRDLVVAEATVDDEVVDVDLSMFPDLDLDGV